LEFLKEGAKTLWEAGKSIVEGLMSIFSGGKSGGGGGVIGGAATGAGFGSAFGPIGSVIGGIAGGIAERKAANQDLEDRTQFGTNYRGRHTNSARAGRRTSLKAATGRLATSPVFAGSAQPEAEDPTCN
jgi:hypothetical protein